MDTATAAAMSAPDLNRWFRRRWRDDPPVSRAENQATKTSDPLTQLGLDLVELHRRQGRPQPEPSCIPW
jgi:hypothetical protein